MEHVPIEQPASPQEARWHGKRSVACSWCVGEADDLLSLEAEVLPTVAADEDTALRKRVQIELRLMKGYVPGPMVLSAVARVSPPLRWLWAGLDA